MHVLQHLADIPFDSKIVTLSRGKVLLFILQLYIIFRIVILRYLCLPRLSLLALRIIADNPDPASGLFHFHRAGFQPWYVNPTSWAICGPRKILLRALGGKAPGNKRCHPEGYNLETIGPRPQEGKGIKEMTSTIEVLRKSILAQCPFSSG
jgi:hypothetical protein